MLTSLLRRVCSGKLFIVGGMGSTSDESQGDRRQFFRTIAKAAPLLGAATAGLQLVPDSAPPSAGVATAAGTALESAIDMALLNAVNAEFAGELPEFQRPDGTSWVRWRKDLRLVAIDVGAGRSRVFQRLLSSVNEDNGGKAVVFQEMRPDGLGGLEDADVASLEPFRGAPIRILFPGLSDTKDRVGAADARAVHRLLKGERSPQVAFVKPFVEKTLLPLLETLRDGDPVSVRLFGHSLGAGNALHAHHLLQARRDIGACTTTLFEPVAAGHEATWILKDITGAATETDFSAAATALAKNVSCIRAHPPTFEGSLYFGNLVANKPFGEAYFTIDHAGNPRLAGQALGFAGTVGVVAGSRIFQAIKGRWRKERGTGLAESTASADSTRVPTRRGFGKALLSGATAFAAGNAVVYTTGKGLQYADSKSHDTSANASKLFAVGDAALTRRAGPDVFPTAAELQAPDDFQSDQLQLNAVQILATALTP